MYDIKTIALDLGVTVQTVYNHFKKNRSKIKPHIFKNKGVTYLNDDGLIIIKKSMGLIQVPEIEKNELGMDEIITNISMQVSDNIKNDLLNDLNSLMKQREIQLIEHYEEKLENLKQEILEKHQEQIEAENKKLMEHLAQIRGNEGKGFFSRLFNK